jgi:hypothetical protein
MKNEGFDILLTFIILLIPFAGLWFIALRYLKRYLKSVLNYTFFFFLTLIGVEVYFIIVWFIADKFLNNSIGDLMIGTSLGTIMICLVLNIPAVLITLFFIIRFFVIRNRNKTKV